MDVVVLLTVFEGVSVVRRSCCCWSPSDGEWGLRRNQIGVGVSSPHGPTRQGLKVSWAGGLAGLWWLPWHGICVCSNTSVCRGCAFVVYERILFSQRRWWRAFPPSVCWIHFAQPQKVTIDSSCLVQTVCTQGKGDEEQSWRFNIYIGRMRMRMRA